MCEQAMGRKCTLYRTSIQEGHKIYEMNAAVGEWYNVNCEVLLDTRLNKHMAAS